METLESICPVCESKAYRETDCLENRMISAY